MTDSKKGQAKDLKNSTFDLLDDEYRIANGMPTVREMIEKHRLMKEIRLEKRQRILSKPDIQVFLIDKQPRDYTPEEVEEHTGKSFEEYINDFKWGSISVFREKCEWFLVRERTWCRDVKYDDNKSEFDLRKIKQHFFDACRWSETITDRLWNKVSESGINSENEAFSCYCRFYDALFSELLRRILLDGVEDEAYCEEFLVDLFTIDFSNYFSGGKNNDI